MVLCVQITLYLKVRMDWLSKTLLLIKQELLFTHLAGLLLEPIFLKAEEDLELGVEKGKSEQDEPGACSLL